MELQIALAPITKTYPNMRNMGFLFRFKFCVLSNLYIFYKYMGGLIVILLASGCAISNPIVVVANPWDTQGVDPEGARAAARRITKQTGEAYLPDGSIPARNAQKQLNTIELWGKIEESKGLAIVALRDKNNTRGFFRGRNLISSSKLNELTRALYLTKGVNLPNNHLSEKDLAPPVMSDGRPYPAVIVHLDDILALQRIKSLAYVDYVEPFAVALDLMAPGCGIEDYQGNPNDGFDLVNLSLRRIPWVYAHHKITQAWKLFGPGGAPGGPNGVEANGVTLFILDTGLYSTQIQFQQPNFSATLPNGERLIREVDYMGTKKVRCSHGTRIAGLAAGPAHFSFPYTGIAWGSPVQISKIGDSVVHIAPQYGVARSIQEAADTNWPLASTKRNKRVLLMAWGVAHESSIIRDVIVDAYDNNEDLIMVAAAGTFVPNVVFPATMEREVVAVSIVNAYKSNSPQNLQTYRLYDDLLDNDGDLLKGGLMAYGKEVDYVAVNGPTEIPTTGNGIDKYGNSTDENGAVRPASGISTPVRDVTTIGGSSSGVAIIGASIALIWSRMPGLTRDGLLARLAQASRCIDISGLPLGDLLKCSYSFEGPHKGSLVGWGIPNVYLAAGGAQSVWIEGSNVQKPDIPFSLAAQVDGDPSIFDFIWNDGITGRWRENLVMPSGARRNFYVTAINRLDGKKIRSANFAIVISGGTHERWLYAKSSPIAYSEFLEGHKIDVPVNMGERLPAGCSVKKAWG